MEMENMQGWTLKKEDDKEEVQLSLEKKMSDAGRD
jgi:hypothetical protein